LVVYGHTLGMGGSCNGCFEFVAGWLHYRYSGDLGVHMFFTISGFLVFASFDRSRDLVQFAKARALRIYPALLVCVLLMVFVVGPLATTMSHHEYFASPQITHYLFSNATLYQAVAELPGVFLTNKMPNIVNGPLWTLPIESRFYMYVALLGVFGLTAGRKVASAGIVGLLLLGMFAPNVLPTVGEDPTYHRLGWFFAAGALLYANRDSVPLDWKVLALVVLFAVVSYGTSTFDFAAGLVVIYAVFWFAFAPKIPLPRFVQDYSYGIYLYGWPIAQFIDDKHPNIGGYKLTAITMALSWIAGAISWFAIERPCLEFKKTRRARKTLTTTNSGRQNLV